MNNKYIDANLNEIFREINYELRQNFIISEWDIEEDINGILFVLNINRNDNIKKPKDYLVENTPSKSNTEDNTVIFYEISYFILQQYCLDNDLEINGDDNLNIYIPLNKTRDEISFSELKKEIRLSLIEFYLKKFKDMGYKIVFHEVREDENIYYDFAVKKID